MITAGTLAKQFGLSRSALLYYDRVGLLTPGGRSASGYRLYSERDVERLDQICTLRKTGLRLEEIERVLRGPGNALSKALEERLDELNGEIESLRHQQRFILGLLGTEQARARIGVMSRAIWTSLLDAAGFTEADRIRWHSDFERQSPEKHQHFLEFLCIPDDEIATIRTRSRSQQGAIDASR